ncbi:zinc finger protein RFP [Salmo trutta]|uniref:zinc finger protein RFP n=1 Tax=Salmo trutta TaxID=8032 RepID=UPI001131EB55|nr:zinc finger protein RFP-like [Salmo trutta]
MAAQLKKLSPVKVTTITPEVELHLTKPGEVSCDVCTEGERKALKSCLVCLVSYCETHLEPHQRVAALTRHKLIDPADNLEDKVCQRHSRPLEMFCRRDLMCVCQICTETDHKTHKTVPIEEECGERKAQLEKTKGKVQQMIQERKQKIREIKHSGDLSKRDTEKDIAHSVEVFTALVRCIEKSQAELIEVIEKKQKSVERQGEEFIKELEQEITELQRKSTELDQLSHTEDHLHLLQSSPSLCSLPPTKNWSEISVNKNLSVSTVMRAVSELGKTLNKEMEKLPEIKLKRIRQCAVDVTFDPDTAHLWLIVSGDGKQVRYGDRAQKLPDNPERFNAGICVLGKEGFSLGRFYYEVQVKEKTEWTLGVAKESINRKGSFTFSPGNGLWTVGFWDGETYEAHNKKVVVLSLREKPQKVGVFVDYEKGEVSFYDVEALSHIYSFTGCTFTEKIYPFYYTHGKNEAPLIICPVSHSEFSP